MDFRNRGVQSQVPQAQTPSQSASSAAGSNFSGKSGKGTWFQKGESALLVLGALLIAAIAFLLYTGSPSQNKAVQADKYQAVFLNNGQVYFGKIKALDSNFIDLQGIYYLQTNGAEGEAQAAAANNNVSLVKLGCELHAPYDQMVINNDQVIFWENLQDGGQVVKAINEYKKQNPKGQTCSNESQNSTQQAPATNTTGTGNAATPAPATQTAPAPTAPRTNTRP